MSPEVASIHSVLIALKERIHSRIIGQEDLVERLIIGLFAGWHILLEWVPGLAKTLTVKTLADALDMEYGRISFTPDLLPSDLIGSEVYRPQTGEFSTRKWPIFTEILLADEINRTPPKVQSALLEAMQESAVTIGDETFPLPANFFVIATENPIEQEGTYRLPEAQLDRFLMKCLVTYPEHDEEIVIMKQETDGKIFHEQLGKGSGILSSVDRDTIQKQIIEHVHVDEKIYQYIADIVSATRPTTKPTLAQYDFANIALHEEKTPLDTITQSLENIQKYIDYGASPRASIAFIRTARVRAILRGRDVVLPEDIQALAPDILRHRIILSYRAIGERITTDMIIDEIIKNKIIP